MEPSTTNSNENQRKTPTPTNDHDHDHDHQPLIISCDQEITSHQAFLLGNASDRLENEPSSVPEKLVIPERWGQEGLLKDLMDYSTFDALLAPKEAGLAREALVAQAAPRGCRVSNIYP